jgi:hypothetical protein
MKNAVFWDVTPCGSCKNRRFREKGRLHHQGDKTRRARNKLAVTSHRGNTLIGGCEFVSLSQFQGRTSSGILGKLKKNQ